MSMFDISRETVRNWAREFGAYLSANAAPGKGRHRVFTIEDVRVFALIDELKRHGALYESIHMNLASGQRGQVPDIDFSNLARIEHSQQITLLQTAVARLENERDRALSQLHAAQSEAEQNRGQVTLLREQLAAAQQEIKTLYRDIARLEADQDN